jgi:hypothetical protein
VNRSIDIYTEKEKGDSMVFEWRQEKGNIRVTIYRTSRDQDQSTAQHSRRTRRCMCGVIIVVIIIIIILFE